jgi:hypothetical protein
MSDGVMKRELKMNDFSKSLIKKKKKEKRKTLKSNFTTLSSIC